MRKSVLICERCGYREERDYLSQTGGDLRQFVSMYLRWAIEKDLEPDRRARAVGRHMEKYVSEVTLEVCRPCAQEMGLSRLSSAPKLGTTPEPDPTPEEQIRNFIREIAQEVVDEQ